MIIEPKLITMAYRCRSCGNTVFGPEGALRLGGDMLKLKCDCGESELSVALRQRLAGFRLRVA